MEKAQASVSLFLDASRPNVENKCLVKLNIYCKPNKKRYPTAFHLTAEEWEKLNGAKLKDELLKGIRQKLNALTTKAEKVIKDLDTFSFIAFEEAFSGTEKAAKSSKLQVWFDDYIKVLEAKERVGTAASYKTTINSLNEFKKGLHLQDITPGFLESYEAHMLKNEKSVSTIGIYLRQLRAIINQAIEASALPADKYPFKKYTIPAGRNIKKALVNDDVERLLAHIPERADQQKAIEYWTISYLCSGINFADIIQLKPSNISGSFMYYFRQKTKNTKKKDLRPIKVGLNERAIFLINKWKNTNPDNPYLFPILEPGLSAKTIKNKCQRFIKWVNAHMNDIRTELGIAQKVGTYVARHTFSTVLKRKGAPTEFIKESLGHASIATTENYLDSFTDDTKLQYANLL